MTPFPETVEFWHWWLLAAVLLTIEVFAPTTIFLWTGISAVAVGFVLLAAETTSWQVQVLLFAVLSVVSIFGWRLFARLHPSAGEESSLNRRAEQHVGRQLTLESAIVNGEGRATIDDTAWRLEGDDLAVGTRVKVVAVTGAILRVEEA